MVLFAFNIFNFYTKVGYWLSFCSDIYHIYWRLIGIGSILIAEICYHRQIPHIRLVKEVLLSEVLWFLRSFMYSLQHNIDAIQKAFWPIVYSPCKMIIGGQPVFIQLRSEERRVGNEC